MQRQLVRLLITGATSYPARLNNDFLYQRLSSLDNFLLRYYSILPDIIPFGKEP